MEVAERLGVRKRLIDVHQYHLMGAVGIFAPDERVELIEGEVIEMAPIGSPHAGNVSVLTRLLVLAAGDRAVVWVQNPVRLSLHSEPQPDLALLKPRADRYRGELPRGEDTLLVVEVADTSLRYDRDVKLGLYAAHGVAEVWLFDISSKSLSVHRDPAGNEYRSTSTVTAPATLRLAALEELEIDLTELFT